MNINIINIIVNYIGFNPNIQFECKFLEDNIDKLDFDIISNNKYIPYSFLKKYEHKIVWNKFRFKPDIPVEFIEKHLDDMNWNMLSTSELTVEFIEKILSQEKYIKKINWELLSNNKYIPEWFFEKHLKIS